MPWLQVKQLFFNIFVASFMCRKHVFMFSCCLFLRPALRVPNICGDDICKLLLYSGTNTN